MRKMWTEQKLVQHSILVLVNSQCMQETVENKIWKDKQKTFKKCVNLIFSNPGEL